MVLGLGRDAGVLTPCAGSGLGWGGERPPVPARAGHSDCQSASLFGANIVKPFVERSVLPILFRFQL